MEFETFWQDVRYALRLLRLNPGFTAVALLSLALGIGANTAIFQLLDSVRLRLLPVKDPQQLVEVQVDSKTGKSGTFTNWHAQMTNAQWEQLRVEQQVFSGMFAFAPHDFNLAPSGEARKERGLWVSGDFFNVLGVHALLGRVFNERDDQPGCGAPGVVISYPFWKSEYAGDPAVIGKPISLEGHTLDIVGVTPANFFGMEVGQSFKVAVPVCAQDALEGEDSQLHKGYFWWLTVMGRLKPGISLTQAGAQLNSLAPALFKETLPPTFHGERASEYLAFTFKVLPAASGISELREDYSTPLWLLLGIAALVLLIACANLANLMLARASAREREIAVRLAVGASRGRIIRQLLAEGVVLAVIGALLGLVLAQWLSRFLVAFLATGGQSLFVDLSPDWRVLGFTAAAATLTCILFGLTPALRGTRISPQAAMKAGSLGLTTTRERFGLRRILVVSQVAMSLVLLFGALLFTRTLRNLMTLDAGFRENGILTVILDYSPLRLPASERIAFKREVLERMRTIPGVESAAGADILPISGNGMNDKVWMQDNPKNRVVTDMAPVSSDYFQTLSIPLLAGRDFSSRDTVTAPNVAIVNEIFAKKVFGEVNPVGKSFVREATSRDPEATFQIVGLVKNTKYHDMREDFEPIFYSPLSQAINPDTYQQILLRSSIPLSELTAQIKRTVTEINPVISIYHFRSFKTTIKDSLLQERLMAMLSGFFGVLAGLLATIGLYGVMSYMVVRRTNEIGIRMALGADRSGIIRMILREAGTLLGIGLAVGMVLALAGARTTSALLYGLKPDDPLTLAASIALLAIVAIAASALPARRAAKLDPMVALREE